MKRKGKSQFVKNEEAQNASVEIGKNSQTKATKAEEAKILGSDAVEIWRDRHQLFMDDAKHQIGNARNVLALWVAALLTLWLGGIEKAVVQVSDLNGRFQERLRKTEIAENSKRESESLQYSIPAEDAIRASTENPWTSHLDLLNVVTPSEKRVRDLELRAKHEQENKRQREVNEAREQAEADARDAKEATEKSKEKFNEGVAFRLFGSEFPILPVLAPSVWMVLLVMMFVYVTIIRKRVFRALNGALRIEREHLCYKPRERLASVPWWFDPLPLNSSQDESRDLDLVVGWRPRPAKGLMWGLATVLMVFVCASYVLLANQRLIRYYEDSEFRKEASNLRTKQWHLQVANGVPYGLMVVAFALIAYWRQPIPVSNHFAGEPLPLELSRSITRRRFLNAGLSGAFGLVGLVGGTRFVSWLDDVVPRNRDQLLAKLKRIRQRRQTVVAAPLTAYANDSADAPRVHFSSPKGAFRFPKAPKKYSPTEIAFAKFEPEAGKRFPRGKRIALSEVSWALELKAMETARNEGNDRRFSDACDILLCAVRHDLLYAASPGKSPSFRLYDLLAGLSVRGNTDHLEKVRNLLAKSTFEPKFQAKVDARMKTWSNSDARWRKRWTGKRKVWIATVADDRESVIKKMHLRLSLKA